MSVACEWRTIPGWDERYEVNPDGQVRSWANRRGGRSDQPRLLKAHSRNSKTGGYPAVRLRPAGSVPNTWRTVGVHQLVAVAFIGARPEGLQVRHLDGDSDNPNVSNLAYGTPVENAADKHLHGTVLLGEKNPRAKLTDVTVAEMRRARSAGTTTSELAKRFGVSTSVAKSAIYGRRWAWVDEPTPDPRSVTRTYAKGEAHPMVKLTEQDVLAIRAADLPPKGQTGNAAKVAALAERYGVSKYTIYDVRNRVIWKGLE